MFQQHVSCVQCGKVGPLIPYGEPDTPGAMRRCLHQVCYQDTRYGKCVYVCAETAGWCITQHRQIFHPVLCVGNVGQCPNPVFHQGMVGVSEEHPKWREGIWCAWHLAVGPEESKNGPFHVSDRPRGPRKGGKTAEMARSGGTWPALAGISIPNGRLL